MELVDISEFDGGVLLYLYNEAQEIAVYFFSNPNKLSIDKIEINWEKYKNKISSELIGKITIEDDWLLHIEVNSEYQGFGIGTKLINWQ